MPSEIQVFLDEAERRVDCFQRHNQVPGFVPSNYAQVYQALHFLMTTNTAPGNLFCEWGSGLGIATCLASMVGFRAYGIEVHRPLVQASEKLAADFGLCSQFYCDSFIPPESESSLESSEASAWLTMRPGDAQEQWGLSPDNFDVIFVYPWPDEERLMESLFEQHAGAGALLLTYNGREEMRVQRKVRRSRKATRNRRLGKIPAGHEKRHCPQTAP